MSLCLLIFLYRIIFPLICNIRRAKTPKHVIHNNFHQIQKCKETVKLYTFCKVLYIISYSFFSSVAGLVRAARRVCQRTESREISNVIRTATTKIHQ